MAQPAEKLNETTAPLTNVALFLSGVTRTLERPRHLPGFISFTGPAGYGKTTAAIYSINKCRAYYIDCRDSWNKKAFFLNLCQRMGLKARATIAEMNDQICEQLLVSGRPLVIDQVDNVVARGYIESLRDIHDGAGNAPIILIGEDDLNNKLKRWERVHSRVLDFILARPADYSDAEHLRSLYCRRAAIGNDLLAHIHRGAAGSCRRICVNLERYEKEAISRGLDTIDLNDVKDLPLFTGDAPVRSE